MSKKNAEKDPNEGTAAPPEVAEAVAAVTDKPAEPRPKAKPAPKGAVRIGVPGLQVGALGARLDNRRDALNADHEEDQPKIAALVRDMVWWTTGNSVDLKAVSRVAEHRFGTIVTLKNGNVVCAFSPALTEDDRIRLLI